ncbi:MAG: cell wall-binding repeat-containing protein [Propionibacteriaceae bacterium]|nr:cell wall-binding repeat-containing protein [Propionibacteriaceae bacterium]
MSMRKKIQRCIVGGVAGGVALAGAVVATAPAHAADVTTSRIGGTDRYHTSALVSRAGFQPGVDTVFVASGESFADALAAGSAAGRVGGPVLLTQGAALPPAIAEEVDRLDPHRIVVVGGEASVSADVLSQLGAHAPTVERIAGVDRYHTAALLSSRYFPVNGVHVFVASGEEFADALAGAAASRRLGAPVLLTARDRLPAATADELERIDANRIIILGGSAAVSDEVFGEAREFLSEHVYREAGADRYETSVRVSRAAFPSADTVYLANGLRFPDALSAAPLAAATDGPVLLVAGDTLTTEVCREVQRLGATRIVALGGTAAVEDAVVNYVAAHCADGTPTPEPVGPPVASGDVPPDQNIVCTSFQTQRQAQEYYDYWVGKGFGDHFKLDEDGDGTPCEALPRG